MRVVIISDFGHVNGGAAKVAVESARGLAEAGVHVVFACAIGPVSERLNHPSIQVERFSGQDVWAVTSKWRAARQGVWNEAAGQFLAKLFSHQPRGTLIHLHQWTKAFSPAAIAAAGKSGLPVVITMHDYFSFCPEGGYFDFPKGKSCQLAPMSLSCITRNCDRASYAHKLVRVARQWGSDRALAACHNLTFLHVSDFARSFAQPHLPAHARHLTVENMMEAEKSTAVDVSRNKHVLFLGRLTEEKGVLLLAEAAKNAMMPVRFVGEGPMAEKISIINPAAELTGWVAAEAVHKQIAAARVIAAPSLWFETGPMAVVEAMAMGVPAIVSDKMGAADWIADGINGRHVAQGSLTELTAALREAMGMPSARWGRNGHENYWAAPFNLARQVDKTIQSYVSASVAA